MRFQCVITGCALVIESGEHYWGDMHRLSDILVFNATMDGGEPHIIEWTPDPEHPIAKIDHDCDPFHRRGVFVMPFGGVTFNHAAIKRMYE
jgi:hypothetical protein